MISLFGKARLVHRLAAGIEPEALAVELRERLEQLPYRLQIYVDHRTGRTDWLRPVTDIMELARANRIGPPRLAAMARRSAEALLGLLPQAERDAAGLDAAFAIARVGEAGARRQRRPPPTLDEGVWSSPSGSPGHADAAVATWPGASEP
jgi:hypothetical protein